MYLEVVHGDSGYWFVRLVGGNGESMMVSELYDSKSNAERAAYNIQNDWSQVIEVKVIDEV